jgi:hypothetical protein
MFLLCPIALPEGVHPFAVRLFLDSTRTFQENLKMTRIRTTRPLLLAVLALGLPVSVLAQPAAKPAEPPGPRVLMVNPAAALMPALKYRLLPSSADLNRGDAAPIYLRIGLEMAEGGWKQLNEKTYQWLKLPLKDFPTAEARQFVDTWSGRLKQIEFGAHRKTCDWNYTLPEQRLDAIAILLPDAQSMRVWGRLLAVKARVEIAERKYDEAIRTIETGLAFARHVGGGLWLINGLVGIANATLMLDQCEELIAQPGAPNLYWALTALPRPLIGLHDQLEVEQKLCENLIPELTEAELARPRNPAEWASLLARMHEGIVKWSRNLLSQEPETSSPMKPLAGWDLDRLKTESIAEAWDYVKASRKLTDPQRAAMSKDQIVALYLAGRYRELRDDLFKASYLPVGEALPQIKAAGERLHAAKSDPLALFVGIQPNIEAGLAAELRLDRRVAALRVIEAIRLHAAAHDGALPESLSQVTDVPVPDDPATGKPFEYHRDGSSATLSGPQAGLPPPWPSYRITIRR